MAWKPQPWCIFLLLLLTITIIIIVIITMTTIINYCYYNYILLSEMQAPASGTDC